MTVAEYDEALDVIDGLPSWREQYEALRALGDQMGFVPWDVPEEELCLERDGDRSVDMETAHRLMEALAASLAQREKANA